MDLLPVVNAPGMTIQQFDSAVDRAHREGLRVIPSGVAGVVFVTSASKPNLCYRVTRETCSCAAGRAGRPCKHRGLAIFMKDIMGGFGSPQSAPTTVRFIHRRSNPQTAA
jgi:hypothetical protein